jgi:hypothetical protein
LGAGMNKKYFELICDLADRYSLMLRKKMDERIIEMEADDNSHYLIYKVLGIAC